MTNYGVGVSNEELIIDEAPMVYKSMGEIINNIEDSVEIIDCIKPMLSMMPVAVNFNKCICIW